MILRLNYLISIFCLLSSTAYAETYTTDVWADNWFQFHINGVLVAEDSVPITTERSFNAESFQFESELPFTIGLIAKDFIENDSGLEYIGTRRQQMGDGGVIVQIKDSSDNVVAISNAAWRCMVIHEAPLHKSCADDSNPVPGEGHCKFNKLEQPVDWNLSAFDDSDWNNAAVYTEDQVRPKDGYDRVRWTDGAELIWGPDLETNNTLLCRLNVFE